MLPLLERHKIQVLGNLAGMTDAKIAEVAGVSVRTVQRILRESPVRHVDDSGEHRSRRIGRPNKALPFEEFVRNALKAEPHLQSKELLRRARMDNYSGAKTAFYELVRVCRPPKETRVGMRFEGLPGEFSQHDFGEVQVQFANGNKKKVVFFASRMKYSRYAAVSIVPDQRAETLVRKVCEHCERFGGIPLRCVFDRPKTVAVAWRKNGAVTQWNETFAQAAIEIGFVPELCWPYQPQQKGAVENLVGWVKSSFFKQRVFLDDADLAQQLTEWHVEVNERTPSRATGVIPSTRLAEEKPRLRPIRVRSEELALRIPIQVGPTAEVIHDTHAYSMPTGAAGISGTLFLYADKVHVVAGNYQATHPRLFQPHDISRLPEHRVEQLAELSGKRAKNYLKRQQLLELGSDAGTLLTEIVHRHPTEWSHDVNWLHRLLTQHGARALTLAIRAALDAQRPEADYVAHCLGEKPHSHAVTYEKNQETQPC